MDREILNRYDKLADKIGEMSGKGWDALVTQVRLEAIVGLSIELFLIILSLAIIVFFIRQYYLGMSSKNIIENHNHFHIEFKKKPIIFDNPRSNDFDLNGVGCIIAGLAIMGVFVLLFAVIGAIFDIPRAIYPEPYAVKELVNTLKK